MSITTKIQEVLAANPEVSWNDLVLRRLRTATSSTDGALNDLWMRWLTAQGYTQGGLQDRMMAYWLANNTPLAERNAFYLGHSAFFSAPPVTVPGAPTIGTATGGNAQASVTFTAPGSDGGSPITGYRVTSNPGGVTATGANSPIVVTGLTNGTAYTFTVAAQNAQGFGPESAASNIVTPQAVNLVVNGEFATDTDWTKGAEWAITGGQAVKASTNVGGSISQSVLGKVTAGVAYRVTYTVVSVSGGGVRVNLAGNTTTQGALRSAPGTYVQDIAFPAITSYAEIFFNLSPTTTTATIDNVSLVQL